MLLIKRLTKVTNDPIVHSAGVVNVFGVSSNEDRRVRVNEDGYVWFCGRRKQIIVHDGSNISPQDVEEALMRHPAVAIAGVVGVPDLVHGENVHGFVTFKQGAAQPTPEELIHFARASVGYKAPDSVFLLDEMPLSATDKVDRVVLKKLAERLLKSEPSEGRIRS